tara:strand:+ start:645 stop:1016 length:372 start_codon:yes stop_codon:yes gene_type:complete
MKKLFVIIFFIFASSANALEKKTTFDKNLFNKAQSEGKIVVINSWIKYCTSCASQMKALKKLEEELSDNIVYLSFEVTNRDIAEFLNVQYQTTLLIYKDNKEVHRSIGVTKREALYKAIKSSI